MPAEPTRPERGTPLRPQSRPPRSSPPGSRCASTRTRASSSRAPCCCACSPRASAAPTSTRSAARPSSTRAPSTRAATPFPIIQGHENVGVVDRGRRRAARSRSTARRSTPATASCPRPNRACGRCRFCQRGFPYYFCRNLENYGNSLTADDAPHLFGGWAEYLYLRPRHGGVPGARGAARRRGGADGDLRGDPQPRAGRADARARRASGRATRVAVVGVGALGPGARDQGAADGRRARCSRSTRRSAGSTSRRLAGAHAVAAAPRPPPP